MRTTWIMAAGVSAALLAGCDGPAGNDAGLNEIEAPDYAAIAEQAASHPERPDADREADARRHPEMALAFMNVAPGLHVFEIEAGSGYYTELLSRAVGPDGSVVMQNPAGFRNFVGDAIDARLAGGRLANVRESYSLFDALDAPDASIDLVTWVQGPHELYYKPRGESLGDPQKAWAEIHRILKPGGLFVAIDHSAVDGAPEETGNAIHRIDRAIVLRMGAAAGFAVDAESDFLANPEDDRTLNVFDPAIRGRTDQFAIRFRKPD